MKKIDNRHTRRLVRKYGVQLTDIGIGKTEIGKQDDHVQILTVLSRRRSGSLGAQESGLFPNREIRRWRVTSEGGD